MSGMHGDHDLGHTVAGWTGTSLAVVGFTLSGVATVAGWTTGFWLGLGVTALAALVTWVLHLSGWGKPSGPRPRADQQWRTRDWAAARGHQHCVGCRAAGRGRRRPDRQVEPREQPVIETA
ncbi:HGxxPAAW family protein [Streptomyces albidochromogenes]|uniref:HGxxPAAW family protein n=1 Tax=Streptomyces albidochromogenes TaxID=329524 RepID=A0ABW6FFR3_9ACTN